MKIGDSIQFTYAYSREWRKGVVRYGVIERLATKPAKKYRKEDTLVTIKYVPGHEETLSGYASFYASGIRLV